MYFVEDNEFGLIYETGCNASSSTTEASMSCPQAIFARAGV
jgi:hypothetical protein